MDYLIEFERGFGGDAEPDFCRPPRQFYILHLGRTHTHPISGVCGGGWVSVHVSVNLLNIFAQFALNNNTKMSGRLWVRVFKGSVNHMGRRPFKFEYLYSVSIDYIMKHNKTEIETQ